MLIDVKEEEDLLKYERKCEGKNAFLFSIER